MRRVPLPILTCRLTESDKAVEIITAVAQKKTEKEGNIPMCVSKDQSVRAKQ
jgi:hypothetical protein